jgi:hypothetical protein
MTKPDTPVAPIARGEMIHYIPGMIWKDKDGSWWSGPPMPEYLIDAMRRGDWLSVERWGETAPPPRKLVLSRTKGPDDDEG